MIDPSTARFSASWQDEDGPATLEDIELDGAEAAIAWGRERSETVLIRLGNRGDTYFSAGVAPAEDDDGAYPLGHLRCHRREVGGNRRRARRSMRSTASRRK